MKSMLEELSVQGWSQCADFLDNSEVERLRTVWAKTKESAHPATVYKARVPDAHIRGDSILWLDEAGLTAEDPLLVKMQQLMSLASDTLFLSLREMESHFACYPPGAGYQAHFDQARGSSARILSLVIYLNPNWEPDHGGELVLWEDEDRSSVKARIQPTAGRLAMFRSDSIFHEVTEAKAPRLSIAMWFRRG